MARCTGSEWHSGICSFRWLGGALLVCRLSLFAGMPGFTCCVPGCYSNSHRDKGLHFYTFPKDPELRHLWLKNVSRAGVTGCFNTFQPTNGHRVCSLHFHGGRKSYSIRVPTIFPLRGINERRPRRSNTGDKSKKSHPAHYSSGSTAVLVTSLPGQEQEVLELTAGSAAEMMLLSTSPEVAGVHTALGRSLAAAASGEALHPDTNPMNLTVKLDPEEGSGFPSSASHHQQLQVVVVGEETYPAPEYYPASQCSDHSYSMSSGTTTEELLRKLNEQRDIIALMEVKMKEMKSSIRHLRITEVKLREEIRQKDKVLNSAKKKLEGKM